MLNDIRRALAQSVSDHESFVSATWHKKKIKKWPIPRKNVQKWTQKGTAVVFFAQTVVCCSKSAYARRAVREPLGLVIAPCRELFASWAVPFFWSDFWKPFFTQQCNFGGKWPPEWTQHEDLRKLFFRKSVKLEKCVWTAPAWTDCIWAHPVERSGRPQNWRKKET